MSRADPKTRCFISLNLPDDIVTAIMAAQEKIRRQDLFTGRFTAKENIHLTLKFLGEISTQTIDDVRTKLRAFTINDTAVELSDIGVFHPNRIRIIWTHLVGVDDIQQSVDDALEGLFDKEQRFMSHITLARVKTVSDTDKLLHALEKITIPQIKAHIKNVSLMGSTLTPDGPIYETIEQYTLNRTRHTRRD